MLAKTQHIGQRLEAIKQQMRMLQRSNRDMHQRVKLWAQDSILDTYPEYLPQQKHGISLLTYREQALRDFGAIEHLWHKRKDSDLAVRCNRYVKNFLRFDELYEIREEFLALGRLTHRRLAQAARIQEKYTAKLEKLAALNQALQEQGKETVPAPNDDWVHKDLQHLENKVGLLEKYLNAYHQDAGQLEPENLSPQTLAWHRQRIRDYSMQLRNMLY